MSSSLFFEHTVEEDIDTAAKHAIDRLTANGYGILSQFRLDSLIMEKTGMSVPPSIVINFCKPSFAANALKLNVMNSRMMPCKLTFYSAPGGKTVVSLLRPTVIADGETREIAELAKMVEEEIRSLI
ncbi:MAG: DUF302 domain-containing protein [Methanomassiliicoccales archaeon]